MFGSKKRDPEALQNRLHDVEQRLLRFEAETEAKSARAREDALASLRLGDDRGYDHAARRYALGQRQHRMAQGLIRMVQGLQDVVDAEAGLDEGLSITEEVKQIQLAMTMDAAPLEEALRSVRTGMHSVNHAAGQIKNLMKPLTAGEAAPEELKAVHEELLATIEKETTIGKRVKEELHGKGITGKNVDK